MTWRRKEHQTITQIKSIEPFEFPFLYTNPQSDVTYDSPKSLKIKVFLNTKSVSLMINPNRIL